MACLLTGCIRETSSLARAFGSGADPAKPSEPVDPKPSVKAPETQAPGSNNPSEAKAIADVEPSLASERRSRADQDFPPNDGSPRLDRPPEALLDAKAQLEESVRMRLRNLEERELEMMQKDKDLARIKQELSNHIGKIATLEDRLQRELGIGKANKDRRAERISALAELIMTMPQQSGAEILANMSDADARDILLAISRKNGRKAAKVLAQMPARRAAQLSQLYLHSNHQIPGSEGLIPKGPKSSPVSGK